MPNFMEMPEISTTLNPVKFLSVPMGFLSGIGYWEMTMLGVIALMLFGSRLPEVARNFGATYKQLRGKVDEFQREFKDWDKEIKNPPKSYLEPKTDEASDDRVAPKTPKFTPPPSDDD